MFKVIAIFSFFLFISCNPPEKASPHSESKVLVEEDFDYGFDPDHPNSEQFNFFLNNYTEEIIEVEADWSEWKKKELVLDRYAYRTKDSDISILLIFCSHQNDCISICSANFEPPKNNSIWGVNGGVAFVISGEDINVINDLAGYFAGEE